MKQPNKILENGTAVVTNTKREFTDLQPMGGPPCEIRRNALGVIDGVVGSCGGDVYWVKHLTGERAKYCYEEIEFMGPADRLRRAAGLHHERPWSGVVWPGYHFDGLSLFVTEHYYLAAGSGLGLRWEFCGPQTASDHSIKDEWIRAPRVHEIWDYADSCEWMPLDRTLASSAKGCTEVCGDCRGRGEIECNLGHDHPCDACGNGQVDVAGVSFAGRLIHRNVWVAMVAWVNGGEYAVLGGATIALRWPGGGALMSAKPE